MSAELRDGQVSQVEILSEAGATLRVISPWKTGWTITKRSGTTAVTNNLLEIATEKGERIILRPFGN